MSENTALATTGEGGTLREFVQSMKTRIAEVLPQHMQPERFIRLILGEVTRVPKLALCTRESLALALLTCSQIGLEPSSPLGHIYLLPYQDRKAGKMICNLIIGYKGYLELARRTQEIARINALPVYQSEIAAGLFVARHDPPMVRHDWAPVAVRPEDDSVIAAYCVVETKSGGRYQSVLNRADIDARRACSASFKRGYGPWVDNDPAMARKCPIRALFDGGTAPMSSEMATALEFERLADQGEIGHGQATVIDVGETADAAVRTLDGLADQLEAGSTPPSVAAPPEPEPPAKPARKPRKDKGTTRGPRKPPAATAPPPTAPAPPPGEMTDWDKALALGDTWGLTADEVNAVIAEQIPDATAPRWTDSQRATVQTVIKTRGKRKEQTGTVAKPPGRPNVKIPGFGDE